MNNGEQQFRRRGTRRRKKRMARKVLFSFILAVILGIVAYGIYFYFSAKNAIDSTYKSAGETTSAAKVVKEKKPLSILLMGADTGAFGRDYKGRTDTMIVATINPDNKKVTLTSIPRDTMTRIIGVKKFDYQRINAAYEVGGSKVALKTVSSLLNIPLEYYVTINMGGLEKIVDAVGGVDVNVPFTFTYEGYTFKKGKMHLKGKMALQYSRMRKLDPDGDYGRQRRQQQVITSIIKAAISTRTLTNFKTVLTQVSKNMVTNLSFDDMVGIYSNYSNYAKTIKTDHVQGISAMWGPAMIQIPATTELQRVSDKLRTEMGLKKEVLSNEETRQNKLNAANGFIFSSGYDSQQFTVYSPSTATENTITDDSSSDSDATTNDGPAYGTTDSTTTQDSISQSQRTSVSQNDTTTQNNI